MRPRPNAFNGTGTAMGLAILGVFILAYILLAYFAARTWQVWHVVLLVFLFLGSLLFCM
jgi:hypothetical protein